MKFIGFLCLVGLFSGGAFSESVRECRFDYFAFDPEHLDCLKQHPAVISIENNLNRLKSLKKSCPRCVEPFVDASQYLDLCEKNYLALNIEEHSFGGYSIDVLFNGKTYAYKLWMYPLDTSEYQLRNISIRKLSKKNNKQMLGYAKEQKYAKYWRIVKC